MWAIRRLPRIGFIFQDPMTSLNPLFTVGKAAGGDHPRQHHSITREAALAKAPRLMGQWMGTCAGSASKSHQFSGGMRQRWWIAIALSGDPRAHHRR